MVGANKSATDKKTSVASGRMKRVAAGQEAIIVIPLIVVVVEVQLTLLIILIEHRNNRITITIRSRRAQHHVQDIVYYTILRILSGLNLMLGMKAQ